MPTSSRFPQATLLLASIAIGREPAAVEPAPQFAQNIAKPIGRACNLRVNDTFR